jgi:hypothetical protein
VLRPISFIRGEDWAGGVGNQCMLFVKRGKDKRLEFVSGPPDPTLSVKNPEPASVSLCQLIGYVCSWGAMF